MKKLFKIIFSRKFIILITALAQIVLFGALTSKFYQLGEVIYIVMMVFSALAVLYIFENDDMNPSYKLFWLAFMLVFPVVGAVFYALYGNTKLTPKQAAGMKTLDNLTRENMPANDEVISRIKAIDTDLGKQAYCMKFISGSPPCGNTRTKYYPMGADLFHDYIDDIKAAKKSIFIQYFIIDSGFLWDKVLEILKEKAARGVDVRVLYDGMGCIFTLPDKYTAELAKYGIKAAVFNDAKFSAHIGNYLMLNHRDHRKLTVIDSNIGYGGGVNIADEYINAKERFGVWKDTGFRIEGEGVWNMTCTFLQSWCIATGQLTDYSPYRPNCKVPSDGYVQHFSDTPLDKYNACESAYLSVINNANEYVYIATPYLILDREMQTSLVLAAQSGIDVRIVVPKIPDKWYVYYVTQSYYRTLINAGVKMYEYTPGFIHAKMYVSDDKQAIVGGANTDYRSMYLNFENCCVFYGGKVVRDVKKDFEDTFNHSYLVTKSDVDNTPLYKRMWQLFLRQFSPLM